MVHALASQPQIYPTEKLEDPCRHWLELEEWFSPVWSHCGNFPNFRTFYIILLSRRYVKVDIVPSYPDLPYYFRVSAHARLTMIRFCPSKKKVSQTLAWPFWVHHTSGDMKLTVNRCIKLQLPAPNIMSHDTFSPPLHHLAHDGISSMVQCALCNVQSGQEIVKLLCTVFTRPYFPDQWLII